MIKITFPIAVLVASIAAACGKVEPENPVTGSGSDGGGLDASLGGDAGGSSSGSTTSSSSGSTGSSSGSTGSSPGGSTGGSSGSNGGSSSGPSTGPSSPMGAVLRTTAPIDKVDLLFMIDNSSKMAEKQRLLGAAIPDLIGRLVTPRCIATDGSQTVVGVIDSKGACASGKPEFPPVHDMHLGIVTSSLGGRGASSVCDPNQPSPASPNRLAHNDDRGELINRGGADEHVVANAGTSLNFLAWFPNDPLNAAGAAPPVPAETVLGDVNTPGTLLGDFADMIAGVHSGGCGYTAQNEAWYRFLAQPDPFDTISISTDGRNLASLNGYDATILKQRHAFLRPDSLLAVIVVTGKNDEVADPMSLAKEGWLFEQVPWPGSPTNGGAPRGTVECASNPFDPNCSSCAFSTVVSGANYATRCPSDPPSTALGYYDPSDDNVNLRFFHPKQRFGIDAGYPVSRYVRGLTSPTVPDRNHEVDAMGNYVGDQDMYANCVNPIFAQDLPTDPTADLCNLKRGPRTPDMVYYAAIAGVPHQLLQATPGDFDCPAGTAAKDCPQKSMLQSSDWLAITGVDPAHYNFSAADVHMLESSDARQTACPPSAGDTCDPVNGREWDTQKTALQFACTFPLAQPRDCTQAQYAGACACSGGPMQNSPLCQLSGETHTSTQVDDGATPSITEMLIAHAMATQPIGVQGVISSACPIHTVDTPAGDPLYGYRPAANAIVDSLRNGLYPLCLPQRLTVDSQTGLVPCEILVTLNTPGDESACSTLPGLSIPPANVLAPFQAARHAAWVAAGGSATGNPDPSALPVCFEDQIPSSSFGPDGTCLTSQASGWCYVQGGADGVCPQQLVFNPQPPQSETLNLLCPGQL